jgi:hypothetical protein
MLALNGVPDQATGALNESELVREAAFQQDTDAKVARHVGHRDQRHVLGDAQVHQLVGLDQDENGLGRWRLDFAKFTPKILSEYVVKTSAECNRLFADQLEAPVQRTEDLILQEDPRFQSFFDVLWRPFAKGSPEAVAILLTLGPRSSASRH